jgi:putative lipoic acid-binding regulatory protein
MTTEQSSLIQFPCDFLIKVIGKNLPFLFEEVVAITRRHFPNTPDTRFNVKLSQQDKYLAIRITVHAEDKPTLDALYTDLSEHPEIHMVL